MLCDFYSLFPSQLKKISGWPRGKSKQWYLVQTLPNDFEELPNTKRVFYQLKAIQHTALMYLEAKGIVKITAMPNKQVQLIGDAVPEKIRLMLEEDSLRNSDYFKLIVEQLSHQTLNGKSGLKMKTGLMEFLYD